ncbi:hypothetical protein AMATHDRAFT_140250 [Amanita thiersii Skay4041]|uniref:rRNA-processing protein FYV7 n=1 Tax=Amanita thiersii Skay4041 TaxID=703135 RepID=A0A2A9NXD1_9AGAR|nr:hypothetical protein AMATHDRAFT_140250 [Amanita thiersii Skay4041]
MVKSSHKPRRPPSFQHYPVDRARKLKRTWVETAKIKSKWKAEKRRAGLNPSSSQLPTAQGDEEIEEQENAVQEPNKNSPSQPTKIRAEDVKTGSEEGQQSLRELTKHAYSRASLHTYKSKPLKKGTNKTEGKEPSRLTQRKGQPNMKLRMNAMLAKMQQKYT